VNGGGIGVPNPFRMRGACDLRQGLQCLRYAGAIDYFYGSDKQIELYLTKELGYPYLVRVLL